jgi:hypothetical protein
MGTDTGISVYSGRGKPMSPRERKTERFKSQGSIAGLPPGSSLKRMLLRLLAVCLPLSGLNALQDAVGRDPIPAAQAALAGGLRLDV